MISKLSHILFFFTIAFCYSEVTNAQTLTQYVKQKQHEVAEMQRIEKQKYDQACQKGTLDAFKEYAKAYPKGKYIDDINKRIEDYDMWSFASSANTISAYNQYLRNSKYKRFKEKADAAIKELQAKEEWNRVKNSTNISDIERYMSAYPNSSCISDAKKRKHELTAVSLYNSGNFRAALNEFNEAGGRSSLQYVNRDLYDKCKEYYDYSQLSSYSKESELESFLKTYPNSEYSNDVSNKLALVKAKGLTMFSSEYSLKSVLTYAKDENTRTQVRNYYDARMREYSQYKKEQRRAQRRRDGGIVNFGIEISDIAFNPAAYNDYDNDINYVMYYNVGLGVKFGNYKSPIQFELGAKPGLTLYTIWYGYNDETKTSFHLPLYARLKINLGGGSNSKWYIDGIGYFNSINDSFLEGDYSASAGVGVSWRHWDWRILYYKQDIGTSHTYSDYKFLGTSLGYYF